MTSAAAEHLAAFKPQRARLRRLAYRMLGSMAEAEDIVQEAWIRWQAVDLGEVRAPAGFLARTVTLASATTTSMRGLRMSMRPSQRSVTPPQALLVCNQAQEARPPVSVTAEARTCQSAASPR